jgi:hypothetical protein
MGNPAFKLRAVEPRYHAGIVLAVEEKAIGVQTEDGIVTATCATSCLIEPTEGDEVALFLPGDGRTFVTAVLHRTEPGAANIAIDGDLHISASGRCRIEGARGMDLASDDHVSVVSKLLSLRAKAGNVLISDLTVLASAILAHADTGRIATKALDWVSDRFSATVKRSYRKVTELDQVRAARIDYRTEQEMCLRSENFLVGSRQLAKLDAEQIHIG